MVIKRRVLYDNCADNKRTSIILNTYKASSTPVKKVSILTPELSSLTESYIERCRLAFPDLGKFYHWGDEEGRGTFWNKRYSAYESEGISTTTLSNSSDALRI